MYKDVLGFLSQQEKSQIAECSIQEGRGCVWKETQSTAILD